MKNLKENVKGIVSFVISIVAITLILLLGMCIVFIPMGFIGCLGITIIQSFILAVYLFAMFELF